MYIIKRFDAVTMTWKYFNTFEKYGDAVEEMERLKRIFGGNFEIFTE